MQTGQAVSAKGATAPNGQMPPGQPRSNLPQFHSALHPACTAIGPLKPPYACHYGRFRTCHFGSHGFRPILTQGQQRRPSHLGADENWDRGRQGRQGVLLSLERPRPDRQSRRNLIPERLQAGRKAEAAPTAAERSGLATLRQCSITTRCSPSTCTV